MKQFNINKRKSDEDLRNYKYFTTIDHRFNEQEIHKKPYGKLK